MPTRSPHRDRTSRKTCRVKLGKSLPTQVKIYHSSVSCFVRVRKTVETRQNVHLTAKLFSGTRQGSLVVGRRVASRPGDYDKNVHSARKKIWICRRLETFMLEARGKCTEIPPNTDFFDIKSSRQTHEEKELLGRFERRLRRHFRSLFPPSWILFSCCSANYMAVVVFE